MSSFEILIMIALVALTTMFTRFAPFIFLKSKGKTPPYLEYLGKALPPAVFGMLVVYCLKSISFVSYPLGIPELIGIALVLLLHLAFRKMLVSVIGGTGVYLLLVNLIFI